MDPSTTQDQEQITHVILNHHYFYSPDTLTSEETWVSSSPWTPLDNV